MQCPHFAPPDSTIFNTELGVHHYVNSLIEACLRIDQTVGVGAQGLFGLWMSSFKETSHIVLDLL